MYISGPALNSAVGDIRLIKSNFSEKLRELAQNESLRKVCFYQSMNIIC